MKLDAPIPSAEPPERVAQRRPDAGGGMAVQAGSVSDKVLQLQRSLGNRYVQRMVSLARQAVGQAEGGALDPEVESSIQRARGGGQALDGGARAHMESAFGADFGGVRIHTGGEADRLNRAVSARAFTTGNDVFFRQGEYNPGSSSGRELLAHELTHVVQQGGSTVQGKLTLGPVDDPAEREADEAARNVMQRSAAPAAQQGSGSVLRRSPQEKERKEFPIKVPKDVTTTLQLLRYAEVQIFGRVVNLAWDTSKSDEARDPAKSVGKTIPFRPTVEALEKYGVQKSSPEEKAETEATYKGLEPEEKAAINAEIDKRYYESMKIDPGTKIKPGEKGKAVVWHSLKEQVLADRKKLAQLPDTVKALLGESNFTPEHSRILVQIGDALSQLSEDELKAFFETGPDGAVITPADYPRLLSAARKLASLSPEARKDYLGRVKASTTSLGDLDRALDRYLQHRAEREKQAEAHDTAARPLLGAEDLYTLYRKYQTKKALMEHSSEPDRDDDLLRYLDVRDELLAALKPKGFDSIEAFAAALESYRVAFRTQAVNIALDVLERYDHMLFEESRKLQRGGAAVIAQGIAATQAKEQYKEHHRQKKNARAIWNSKEPKENWWQKPYNEAMSAAAEAKSTADADVLRGSGNNPLVAERNVDLEKLAGLDAAGTHTYLSDLIKDRSAKVRTARQEFKDDPNRIFSLPELVAATRTLLGIDPTTIYGRSIQGYIDDEAAKHLLSQIALTILSIALVFLVPGGGWLAAAALVGQAGLSTYQAYTAYKEYETQERDYELGFLSTEPSLIWVGLAIAGAALDIGTTATLLVKQSAAALKALKKPMLDFAGDSRKLPELLEKIEAAQGLDLKLKAALAREAEAAAAAKSAWKQVLGQASRMHGFAGVFVDPELVVQLFRALYHSVRRGINTMTRLSADAKLLEITGDITRLSGAERAQLQAAFDEVKQIARISQSRKMDEETALHFVERWAAGRGKPAVQTKLLDEMKAWKPLTAEQRKALGALEAKKQHIASLYERKAIAEEELADLRAQPTRTPEDVAEIRALEAEIKKLDTQALPGSKSGPRRGQIADQEKALELLEEEARKASLSLYDRLRAAAPSAKAKDRALKGITTDQVGPLKTRPGKIEADHIVPVREVSDMDGFTDLPWKDQKEIVDMKENLIAMDKHANASKNDRSWRSWPQSGNFYGQTTIDAMVKREAEVRALIQEEIQKRLAKLAGKTATAVERGAGTRLVRPESAPKYARADPPADFKPEDLKLDAFKLDDLKLPDLPPRPAAYIQVHYHRRLTEEDLESFRRMYGEPAEKANARNRKP